MSNYILKRVLKKIRKQIKIYSIIILQFAVGFFILNTFISTSISIKNEYNSLIKEAKEKEFSFTATYNNKTYFNRDRFDLIVWGKKEPTLNKYEILPFDALCLNSLQNKFTNVIFNIKVAIDILYLSGEEGQEYKVYYSSNYNNVQVSKSFLEVLNNINTKNTVNPRDFPHLLSSNELNSINGFKYTVNIIEKDENAIFIPIEAYYDIYHPKDLGDISLDIKILDKQENYAELLGEINDELNKRYGGTYTYSIGSEFIRFISSVDRAREETLAFNFIAGVLLLIILIGLSGLFVLIINRRKKEIAICLALGAHKDMVYLEVAFEMCILAFLGSVIGIISSLMCLKNGFEIATVISYPSLITSLFLLLFSILIAIISTIPVLIIIKKLMPLEILRTE